MNNLKQILKELDYYIDEDGRVPKELFFFIAERFGECCLELCVFKEEKIFLIPRGNEDPYWAGKLHIPGVRKIATDNNVTVLRRAINETGLHIKISDVKYCSSQIIKTKRGTEFSDLRFVEYQGRIENGFYDIFNLPENIIDFQYQLINDAAECYFSYKNM